MADCEFTQIAVAVATLAGQDVRMAAEARTALEWILDEQGLGLITQERIQNFCWYDLPVSWVTNLQSKIQVAEALARALDLLQLNRYATICRSQKTLDILEAYETNLAKGAIAFRRASAASGIAPPDLPEFTWGAAMGFQEASAWWSVSGSLELAIMAGDLRPGTHGWKAQQREITRAKLNIPGGELPRRTPAQMIASERVGAWLKIPCSKTRRDVLSHTCDRLLHCVRLPAQAVADPLPRLRWLLEQMNEGIGLTRAGNMNTNFVRHNANQFGWRSIRPPRAESEVGDLLRLRMFATRLRLSQRSGHTIRLSSKGQRLLIAPSQLWQATATGLLQGTDFTVYIGELLLGIILSDDAMSYAEIRRIIKTAVKEEGFRERRTGESPNDRDITDAITETSDLCHCLGLLADTDPAPSRYSFTDIGAATALQALRIKATGPRGIPRYMSASGPTGLGW